MNDENLHVCKFKTILKSIQQGFVKLLRLLLKEILYIN